jgi:hypothetical protein
MSIILIDLGLVALGLALGALHARRILHRQKGVTLYGVHRHLGIALWAAAASALVLGAGILVISNQNLLWKTPVEIEIRIPTALWTLILFPMSYFGTIAVVVAHRCQDSRKKSLLTAIPVLLIAFGSIHWSRQRTIADELTHVTDPNGIILQSSGVSCAAASAANILNQFGMKKTEAELATILGTTATGTSSGQVIAGLRRIKIGCRRASFDSPEEIPFPAMLFVDDPVAGPESHAVALVSRTTGGVCEVWDPLDGRHEMTPEKLRKIWHGKTLVFDVP